MLVGDEQDVLSAPSRLRDETTHTVRLFGLNIIVVRGSGDHARRMSRSVENGRYVHLVLGGLIALYNAAAEVT